MPCGKENAEAKTLVLPNAVYCQRDHERRKRAAERKKSPDARPGLKVHPEEKR